MSDYIIHNGTLMSVELYHHGIKGMKWGKRRYQNADGSLTPAGIKRYAKKAYAKESYKSNQTTAGKVFDRISGAHRIDASMRYHYSSQSQNKDAAEKYLADQRAMVKKGTQAVGTAISTVGLLYVQDQAFYGGMGTKAVKTAVKHIGRTAVSAYVYARGGRNIRWYDN